MLPSLLASATSSRTLKIAPLLVSLLLLVGLPVATAGAEITYQHETLQEYEKQLASGQIKSATINKKTRSVRVLLTDGRYVLAKYPAHGEPAVAKALEAKHVPVTVLSKEAADREAKKKVHHKIRYIAAGVLVAVVVIGGGVLLFDRRRKALRD